MKKVSAIRITRTANKQTYSTRATRTTRTNGTRTSGTRSPNPINCSAGSTAICSVNQCFLELMLSEVGKKLQRIEPNVSNVSNVCSRGVLREKSIGNVIKNARWGREQMRGKEICERQGCYLVRYFRMLLERRRRRMEQKCDALLNGLISLFARLGKEEKEETVRQINSIAPALIKCLSQNTPLFTDLCKPLIKELPKLLFNLTMEIYLLKNNQAKLEHLTFIYKHIEYYSRSIGMLSFAMLSCMEMGRNYCRYYQFESASQQYTKAIKLAIVLGDKYAEQQGIDMLGMCQYYRGDAASANAYHKSMMSLSAYSTWKIKDSYSNEKEIEKMGNSLSSRRYVDQCDWRSQLQFDFQPPQEQYSEHNLQRFKSQFKQIIKLDQFRPRMPIIKKAIAKNQAIGLKRHFGVDYVPRAGKASQTNKSEGQFQVLLSHCSPNRQNGGQDTSRIDRERSMLQQILRPFLIQNKVD